MGRHKRHGFTIVELLIVIVVIAILAAITIIAFNGVQQRAHNSAKIAAVQSVSKLISLYRTEHNGAYPETATGDRCATVDSVCRSFSNDAIANSNTNLIAALQAYGTVPATSGDNPNAKYGGITYMYDNSRTLDGVLNPFLLLYSLEGLNQDCTGIGGMVSVGDGTATHDMTPKVRSKSDTESGRTRCYEMFAQ